MADGIPPAYDYNIVLGADDLRDLEYIFSSVTWMEPGLVPSDFELGLDDAGRLRRGVARRHGARRGDAPAVADARAAHDVSAVLAVIRCGRPRDATRVRPAR